MKRPSISAGTRFKVLERDGFKCIYCGKPATEVPIDIDHKKAVADGGTGEMDNLVSACVDCNSGKGGPYVSRGNKPRGGRPPGVRMPCGWGCGAELTATDIREHFTACPNRGVVEVESKHPVAVLEHAAKSDAGIGRSVAEFLLSNPPMIEAAPEAEEVEVLDDWESKCTQEFGQKVLTQAGKSVSRWGKMTWEQRYQSLKEQKDRAEVDGW